MHRAVIVRTVCAHLTQQFECRILIRRHDDLGEHRRLLPHGYLQPRHGSGFDLKPLGVVADCGEDQLCFAGHIDPQRIRAVLIGTGTNLRAPKMNIDIRNRFTGRLIDYLTDDDGFYC